MQCKRKALYLLLRAADDGCVITEEAQSFGPLIRRLQGPRGFGNGAVISAMGCTDQPVFPCRRRIDA